MQEVIDWTHELTPLVDRVADELGLKVIVKKILRLSGGAINQNFLIELTDSAGTVQRWVLRRSQSVSIPGSLSRAAEYAIVSYAHEIGIRVPKPIALIDTPGSSASIFQWCVGETDGRALLAWLQQRDKGVGGQLPKSSVIQTVIPKGPAADPVETVCRLTESLGFELGRLHSELSATRAAVRLTDVLGARPVCGFIASIDLLKNSFARIRHPKRYLTGAFQACLEEAEQIRVARGPGTQPARICHNDFRLGNLMMDPHQSRLTAILDWEFTSWGDPLADIGWLSAPCWRFGGGGVVAGFGALDDFLRGYASASQDSASLKLLKVRLAQELSFWQRFAHLRWAIVAAQQGERAISGDAEALELLLTAAMVPSILEPIVAHYWGFVGPAALNALRVEDSNTDSLLAEAGHHLKTHLATHLSGAQRYSALMTANAVRLGRGALRAPRGSGSNLTAIEQAKADFANDLAVWKFRG